MGSGRYTGPTDLNYNIVAVHPYQVHVYSRHEGAPGRKNANFDPSWTERDNESPTVTEKSISKETWRENFANNDHKGIMSKASVKKLSRALDYLIYLAKKKTLPEGRKGAGLSYKLAFITLTLSAPQSHPDKQIIHNVLDPLLNWLRKSHSVKNYIWRAEKQKNGNIHFHLVIDQYVPWQELRNAWNRYQQNLGYVTRYRESQEAWHREGFKPRKKLLKKWSLNAQYEAYIKGKDKSWNNPNSTDVHSIRAVKNVKSYICKYMVKNELSKKNMGQAPPLPEQGATATADRDFALLLIVSSRLWACSQSLSGLRGAEDVYTGKLYEEIEEAVRKEGCKVISSDYYCIYCIPIFRLRQYNCITALALWDAYIKKRFEGGTKEKEGKAESQ